MSYPQRLSFLFLVDSLIVLTSIYVSNFILVPGTVVFTLPLLVSSLTLLLAHHAFAYIYRLYKRAWEYASVGELVAVLKSVSFAILITALVQAVLYQNIFMRTLAITWMMHILLIGGSRFSWRVYRDTYLKKKKGRKRALIVGAGSAGRMVARQLFNRNSELLPVAFVDDDPNKQGLQVMGVPVAGNVEFIVKAVKEFDIDHIVIAIPSLSKKELNHIFQECSRTKIKTQIIPLLEDLIVGNVSVTQFRDVRVEDLLGREPVELDVDSLSDSITGKVVMVTGAGGSIGSEICRQIIKFNPSRIVLLDNCENNMYAIEMELKEKLKKSRVSYAAVIADIQSPEKMEAVMARYRPDVVYHAAAHKHVPLMEQHPDEAVKNNVIGTRNVAEAADKYRVETFVMISTDKAVNPSSVMGATKRLAEMVVQHMNSVSATRFVAVRFGNVLGSRGSVIPLFKKQIKKGGPVTVTDPKMMRYFMTIPEASRLVMQAGALAHGGEIFVLDMGDPVKIVDLAKNLIRLSGYSLDEIGVTYTGARPGEKLREELMNKGEISEKQVYPNIHIGKRIDFDIRMVEEFIADFERMHPSRLKGDLLAMANNEVGEHEPLERIHA